MFKAKRLPSYSALAYDQGQAGKYVAMMVMTLIAALLITLSTPKAAHAMKIEKVTSPGGIEAWLVKERGIPLIAMQFAFRGGTTQDPKGKEGLAHLLSGMMDEGAGDMSAAAFQERAEELAIRMRFSASRDAFSGSFQTLSENKKQAIEMFRLALNEPRFDANAIERVRRQIIAGLKFDENNPGRVASRAWFEKAFAGHPYARPSKGTEKSVLTITPEDLHQYRKNVFAKDTLKVAVVGDIDAKNLGLMLDKIFGKLPAKAKITPVKEAKLSFKAGQDIIRMDVPQSVARFGHSGFKRHDKDFIPGFVLNYILGGGGFSSRLTEEVREKRGLAYSVYSSLYPLERAALFIGGVATKNTEMAQSIKVIKQEFARMAEKGPTQEELQNAKNYLTGSYALRFDTSNKIASQLLWIQVENLGMDYIEKRNSLIEAVTLKDLKRVAKRLLKVDQLQVTIVGRPNEKEKTEKNQKEKAEPRG